MKMLLIFTVLSVISSVYGQVIDGSFWWENNNASQPRAHSGQIVTTSATTTYNPTVEEVWCTCVTWYHCENNTIITDGAGIIDIRDGSVPVVNVENCTINDGVQKEICCGSRPTPPPSLTPSSPTVDPILRCECIPQSLCNNGIINTDGAGILNPRFGNKNITVNVKFCPETGGEDEICCGIPPVELTTEEQSTFSPASSTVYSTEETTSTSKVTIGPTLSPPGSHTGTNNSASYFSNIILLQMLLVVTQLFVTSQLL